MNLGKAIKMIRVYREMSQEDLAAKVGVTGGYISLLERNKRDPGLKLVCSIAASLGVPLITLVFLAEKDELRADGTYEKVIEVFSGLTGD